MRFKKGTRVEVLDRKEQPLGHWRCGEIISDNRHSCTVRYYGQKRKNNLAKVSCSALRPCQPHLGTPKKWAAGDVLEVFHDLSWKMGKVVKSLGCNSYLVRVVGTSELFMVDLCQTRVRQSWHNGRWTTIGQVSGIAGVCVEDGQFKLETTKGESSYLYPKAEAHSKGRVCAKERDCCSEFNANQTKLPRLMPDDVSLRTEDSDACSMSNSESHDASSIGSCSITDDKHCESSPEVSDPAEDIRSNMSISESFNHGWYEEQKDYICSNSRDEDLEAAVHSLELCAYRRTMDALHASGALSWDRESLMSNLRVSLNISSEEHLAELIKLLSANNSDTPI